jgi:hypothetical protein
MKKIYIAGPISGHKNYKRQFNQKEWELTDEGHICMNPANLSEGFPWRQYLKICYAMIRACDTIYMMNGWSCSTGACIELQYARELGLNILYEDGAYNGDQKIE